MTRSRCAGMTLLELLVVMAIISILMALLLSGVQKVREASSRVACQNNVRQIGLGVQHLHDVHGSLPAGMNDPRGNSAMPSAGWMIPLLPYIEQKSMHDEAVSEFKRTRSFRGSGDYPHIGLSRPVKIFLCPSDGRIHNIYFSEPHGLWVAFTSYVGNCGINCQEPNGVLYNDSHVRFRDITDGLSHTILLGERPPSANLYLGWWYAGYGQDKKGSAEMILGVREPYLGLELNFSSCDRKPYEFTPGRLSNNCDAFHYWSPHSSGASFGFCDGSVRFLKYEVNSLTPSLASRSGGESIGSIE